MNLFIAIASVMNAILGLVFFSWIFNTDSPIRNRFCHFLTGTISIFSSIYSYDAKSLMPILVGIFLNWGLSSVLEK